MSFLHRHKYALLVLAVIGLSGLLTLRQMQINESHHIQLREDFILLHQRGEIETAQHLYQELIQSMPQLPDERLLEDLQRLAILNFESELDPAGLLLKYKGAVQRVLEKRAEKRVQQLLKPSLP